jgi:hypothetical protein
MISTCHGEGGVLELSPCHIEIKSGKFLKQSGSNTLDMLAIKIRRQKQERKVTSADWNEFLLYL